MFKMYRIETSLDLIKDLNPPEVVVRGTWSIIICDFLWFYTSKPEDKISNSIVANAAYLAMTQKTYFEIWVSLDKSKTHPYGQVIGRLISREDAEKRIAELEAKRDYGKIEGIQVDWKDNWRDEEWKMKEEKNRLNHSEVVPLDKHVSLVLNSDKKLAPQDIKSIKYKVSQYLANAKFDGIKDEESTIYEDDKVRISESTKAKKNAAKETKNGVGIIVEEGEKIFDSRVYELGIDGIHFGSMKVLAKQHKDGQITYMIKAEYDDGRMSVTTPTKATEQEYRKKVRELEEGMQPTFMLGNPVIFEQEYIEKLTKISEEASKSDNKKGVLPNKSASQTFEGQNKVKKSSGC